MVKGSGAGGGVSSRESVKGGRRKRKIDDQDRGQPRLLATQTEEG